MNAKPAAQVDLLSTTEARAIVVEQLCDGFSHDTRNPLNAMVIHLEVLSDKLRRENGGAVPFGLERNIKAIRDQVGRIDEMVRRFVELTAPRRQHESFFDLTALAGSVVEQCTHQARLARADLHFEGLPGLRILGSASALGVALALVLAQQVDAGTKRLLVCVEGHGTEANLGVDGMAGMGTDGPLELLHREVKTLGGRLTIRGPHLELSLPVGRENGLHMLETEPSNNP